MIKKYLFFCLFFIFFVGIAQTKFILKGQILFENFPIQKIEIININTEKIVFTNTDGFFEIEIKVGNSLVIGSTSYNYKTIIIKKEDVENTNFKVFLTKKIEELDEVVINNVKIQKIGFSQAELDAIRIKKANTYPMNMATHNPIPNGMDFIAIGEGAYRLIKKLFNNESEKPDKIKPIVDIQTYISKNFKPNYLSETLRLKHDEINLFYEFCKADVNFKSVFESENVLLIMDFLTTKNKAFKLKTKNP